MGAHKQLGYSVDTRFSKRKIFQRNFEKPLDKLHQMWYNKNVKRELVRQPYGSNDNAQAGGVSFALKKYERKFQKPLDKSAKVWYNNSTKGKGEHKL